MIPKGDLVEKKPAVGGSESPRYFYFEQQSSVIIVSGWFESSDGFQGIKKFWKSEKKGLKQNNFPEPQSVIIEKNGNWETILYDIPVPAATGHLKASNSHLRAEWVQEGTWIDIHLSITSEHSSAESREILRTLLKTIQVRVKEK